MSDSTILRNQRIYNLAKSGTPVRDIAEEYGISRHRVYQIIEKLDNQYVQGDDSLYILVMKAGRSKYISPNVINLTFSRLKRNGIETVEDLLELDIETYADKWFVGDIQKEIVSTAKMMAETEME